MTQNILTHKMQKQRSMQVHLKKCFKLKFNCFTMLCQFLLYNNVNQLHVYTYPLPLSLPPTPPILPILAITEHRAELPELCSRTPLATYLTHGSAAMSVLPSQLIPLCSSFPLPLSPFSACASLFLPCKQVHQYHFSRFHVYVVSLQLLNNFYPWICPLKYF